MGTYHENIQEIHSSEGRYKSVILRNNNLIIPYINLGVSDHPIHENSKGMTFIDYSYMVFRDVSYLSVYIKAKSAVIGGKYIVICREKSNEIYNFGGDYWDFDTFIFNDMEICCKEAYLQTLEFTKLSSTMWIPFTTEIFIQNMDANQVDQFFDHDYIPTNVKSLII